MSRKSISVVIYEYNSHELWDLNKHFQWARALVVSADHDEKTGLSPRHENCTGGRKIFLNVRVITESEDDLSSNNMFLTFT
jgi:hypothetical protein